MNESIYEKAIRSLEQYKNVSGAKSIVERAKESLRSRKENENLQELLLNVDDVLAELQNTARGVNNLPWLRIIARGFFRKLKFDGNSFVEMVNQLEDVFSLNASSGAYVFQLSYIVPDNIIVKRLSGNGRRSRFGGYQCVNFPRFDGISDDVQILRKMFQGMRIDLSRTWKYLKVPKTPSDTETSVEDLEEFLENPV